MSNPDNQLYRSRWKIVGDELCCGRGVEVKGTCCEHENGQGAAYRINNETSTEDVGNAATKGLQEMPEVRRSAHMFLYVAPQSK